MSLPLVDYINLYFVDDIASQSAVRQRTHFHRIKEFVFEGTFMPVGLLIEGNCTAAQQTYVVILSQCDGSSMSNSVKGFRTALHIPAENKTTKTYASHHFAITNNVKECEIQNQLNQR